MNPTCPSDTWHGPTLAWAMSLTAPRDVRAAAIACLVDADDTDSLSRITDPLGRDLINERRSELAAAQSRLVFRPLSEDELRSIDILPPRDAVAVQTSPQMHLNQQRIMAERWAQRRRLVVLSLPFVVAALVLSMCTGHFAGYVHAKAATTVAQAQAIQGM